MTRDEINKLIDFNIDKLSSFSRVHLYKENSYKFLELLLPSTFDESLKIIKEDYKIFPGGIISAIYDAFKQYIYNQKDSDALFYQLLKVIYSLDCSQYGEDILPILKYGALSYDTSILKLIINITISLMDNKIK